MSVGMSNNLPKRGERVWDPATQRVGVVQWVGSLWGPNDGRRATRPDDQVILRPPRGGIEWVARAGTMKPYEEAGQEAGERV
ncbi:hypothetical protein ACFP1Z_32695 [Streptomyces gamaensis]|uniref:Uncharacterized protein n=1 Tax=Streptomyces gamaensis TaxID=1763542 RepID=A0ABW0Z886_9ACTN